MKADHEAAKETANGILTLPLSDSMQNLATAFLEQSAELARLREAAKKVMTVGIISLCECENCTALRELLKEGE